MLLFLPDEVLRSLLTIRNVDTNELDTMWEDSLLEFLHEAKAKAAVHDIEDSEGEVED